MLSHRRLEPSVFESNCFKATNDSKSAYLSKVGTHRQSVSDVTVTNSLKQFYTQNSYTHHFNLFKSLANQLEIELQQALQWLPLNCCSIVTSKSYNAATQAAEPMRVKTIQNSQCSKTSSAVLLI